MEKEYIIGMRAAFLRHRRASESIQPPDAGERIEKLKVLRDVILESRDAIAEAVSHDYGYRVAEETDIADILPAVTSINYCRRHIRRWMRPERRSSGIMLFPARVRVEYQPLGVVGIMVPWNFPLALSVGPLAYAVSAGNRAMLKMSPRTPEFNRVLAGIISEVFFEDEVTLFEGAQDVSRAFCAMPFDHLFFTGSTKTGRQVMRAAAENLTPVTLELGGKSPVIIDAQIPMRTAVKRMLWGKCMNAGQVCIAPDYVLVPRSRVEAFVAEYRRGYSRLYPHGRDVTNMVDDEHTRRIEGLLEDARKKGASIVNAGADPVDRCALSTRMVLNVTADMDVMKEEIFGPVLPVIPYDDIEEAISFVRSRPRPLALYVMSLEKDFARRVIDGTVSGTVVVNDTVMQFIAEDAPFGGTGHSGMGRYHGREGFRAFSNTRTVMSRGRFFNTGALVFPPTGGLSRGLYAISSWASQCLT